MQADFERSSVRIGVISPTILSRVGQLPALESDKAGAEQLIKRP